MPGPLKAIFFMLGIGVLLGTLLNQCPMEAKADGYWNSDVQRREVQALENIADSLKKIERKMK